MRTIYIDDSFICHSDYAEGRTAVQTTALDNVCDEALRFYIYVPVGSTCTMPNGITGKGEFVQCVNSASADMAQWGYEKRLLADLQANSISISELESAYQEGVNSAYG